MEVAPDLSRDVSGPLAVITKLQLTANGEVTSFIDDPVKVSRDGFKCPIRITVPADGEAVFEMQWWSWIDAAGGWDSGFSLKRFAEVFSVRVGNRSPLTVRIMRDRAGPPDEINYGEELIISSQMNVTPRTRVEFFWAPPLEHPSPDGRARGESLTGLLDFDRRLGEKPKEKF